MNIIFRAMQIASEGREMSREELAAFMQRDCTLPVSGEEFCRWIATGIAGRAQPEKTFTELEGGGRVHQVNQVDGYQLEDSL